MEAATQKTIQGMRSSIMLVFGPGSFLPHVPAPAAPAPAAMLPAPPAAFAAPKYSSQCIIRSKSPSTEYKCLMSASSPAISPLAIERQTLKGVLICVVQSAAKPSAGFSSTWLPRSPSTMR